MNPWLIAVLTKSRLLPAGLFTLCAMLLTLDSVAVACSVCPYRDRGSFEVGWYEVLIACQCITYSCDSQSVGCECPAGGPGEVMKNKYNFLHLNFLSLKSYKIFMFVKR